LCERLIPAGAKASRHHLVPKLKGGAKGDTVLLHQICHSTLHAHFSEAELARRLNTVEALRQEPSLADFLNWIRTKPDDFHAPTRQTSTRIGSRREASRRHR
jgi:5-methylcytosine-specific restriction enzyme A